jgi:RND family efflux transporter MFP subunit
MQKRVWFIVSATALVIIAILVVLHARHQTPQVEAAPGPPAAQVAEVRRGNIDQVLTLAGQFQPYQEIDIHPKVSGFIRHIYVDIGDRVHKGETLAVLEVPELKAQLTETAFEVQRAQDEITRAQHNVARAVATHSALHADYNRLLQTSKVQPGLVAQQELDDAQAKDLSSAAAVDAAQAALSAAQKGLQAAKADNQRVSALENYTDVVAPLDGVIVWRYADTGALIQGGTTSNSQALPIVRLAQSGLMRLRLPVPEQYVKFIHIGDPVKVRVDAVNSSFTGMVVRFTREVNFETRTMETEIDVPNPNLAIDSGMYADALLQMAHADDVPTMPIGAMVLNGKAYEAYVVDRNNRVQIRPVKLGIEGSRLVQVVSGLHPGDRVITAAQEKYAENEQVTPVLQKTPASEVAPQSGGVIDMSGQLSSGNGGA